MSTHLFLFCGGAAVDEQSRPKPLMKIREGRSLLVHFLYHLEKYRAKLPASITLLCDNGQEKAFETEAGNIDYPVPIHILACGSQASTFEKFEKALHEAKENKDLVQFGYPDIFFFGEHSDPEGKLPESEPGIYISVTTLTSRFPRLIVDVYNNEIKGISNYSSAIPANPLHIFGGDLWGRTTELLKLVSEFKSQTDLGSPSLEYDFFFWLINHMKTRCLLLYGEWMEIDSIRDIRRLLAKTAAKDKIQ